MTVNIYQDPGIYHEDRKTNEAPSFLIIHYTGTTDAIKTKDMLSGRILNDAGQKVSVHYMVDQDGTVTQFVPEDRRAYHAGVSHWEGVTDINSHSIGIELFNPGAEHGYEDFPDEQIDALISLCQDILSRHNIPACRVLGHSDVAPGRKVDPGEKFPWQKLAQAGIGLWPQPIQEDFNRAALLYGDENLLKAALVEYGYDPAKDLSVLVAEFQRHFEADVFKAIPPVAGEPSPETGLKLAALLRQKFTP